MKLGILTSGGDAPGMNAAIRAAVRKCLFHGHQVYGFKRGFLGLMNGEYLRMDSRMVGGILSRGGTILLTARAPEFKTEEGIAKGVKVFQDLGLDALIVIGGNGSQTGAFELCKRGIPVIGIASTIDNDLWGTDKTIGFDTAVNNAMNAIDKIRDTATSHERVFVVEVMGRDVGFIAMHCGIAVGADEIVIPEIPYHLPQLSQKIKDSFHLGKKHFIIVLAEGVEKAPQFSQKLFEASGIEAKISTLGYLQRGGDPSYTDRFLATTFGVKAAEAAINGESGKIVGIRHHEVCFLEMSDTVGKVKKVKTELYQLTEVLGI
ncbi:MAG TPA: ATP-dependent 6-phosphofructokinase [Caldisericia bacterium]|nr:ATP-dependent 6-phosphofructokinase [Caldisericia bacterium]